MYTLLIRHAQLPSRVQSENTLAPVAAALTPLRRLLACRNTRRTPGDQPESLVPRSIVLRPLQRLPASRRTFGNVHGNERDDASEEPLRPRKQSPIGGVPDGLGGTPSGRVPQQPGPQQQHQPNELEPIPSNGIGSQGGQRRRRGRPRRSESTDGASEPSTSEWQDTEPRPPARRGRPPGRSGAFPPGEQPHRNLELQTLLLRQLQLKPHQLRPPKASWRKLMVSMTPGKLADRVSKLVTVLGLNTVRCMAIRCPHVFALTPCHILTRLSELTVQLLLPRQELMAVVCRFPALLGFRGTTVGDRVALLMRELDRPADYVLRLVSCQPQVLGLAPATLLHRIDLLHEAASQLPDKWIPELSRMHPSTLGRLLRCSDTVLQRLTFTYLRCATNGRKFQLIRHMSTICTMRRARWHHEQPLFLDWLAAGEADRRDGVTKPWVGWYRQEWWGKEPRRHE